MALVGALLVLAAPPALSRAATDAHSGDLSTPHTAPNGVPSLEVPIRRRKFEDSVSSEDDRYGIAGQIPRSGPATGTIRLFSAAFSDFPNCDSGVVSWTATASG